MPAYNGNDAYLMLNGVDLSPYWGGSLNIGGIQKTAEDITSGSGKQWMEFAIGMKGGNTYDIPLRYFPSTWNDYKAAFYTDEVVEIQYGWHNNDSGRPVFDADVLITNIDPVLSHSQSVMEITITLQLTGEPRKVPYHDTFA